MRVSELFGAQDSNKKWEWEYFDNENVSANFTVGNKPYHFSAIQSEDEAPRDWDVEFKDPAAFSPYGITGSGRSAEVFSTVVSILKDFINKKGKSIRRLLFAAKEGSRQDLYAKMAKRLLPGWHLTQDDEYFILTRPGLTWWVYSVEFFKIPAVKIKSQSADEAIQIARDKVSAFKDADPRGMVASAKNRAGDTV
jgi:hypothetical protein